MTLSTFRIVCLGLGLFLTQPLTADEEKPYTITDGKADINTYVGWKVFHMNCYSCHGVDAVGTDVAPSLVDSLKDMNRNEFITKVLTRYRLTMGAGEVHDSTARREMMMAEVQKHERAEQGDIIMPAWSQSPYVKPHVEDLFAYLKARADGALGTGEPQKAEP